MNYTPIRSFPAHPSFGLEVQRGGEFVAAEYLHPGDVVRATVEITDRRVKGLLVPIEPEPEPVPTTEPELDPQPKTKKKA